MGGSRVLPMNSTMDGINTNMAAFTRFVDKNRVYQREREIAVEQAVMASNKRYILNINTAK